MSVIGKLFMSAVLAEGSIASLISHGPIDHLFTGNDDAPYHFIRGFIKEYAALPTAETIEAHTGEGLAAAGQKLEPSAYYLEMMRTRHVENAVKKVCNDANAMLAPDKKDVMGSLQLLTSTVMELAQQKAAKQVHDFRDAYDLIMSSFAAVHGADNSKALMLGWPTLDKMTGGLVTGDLISYVGRPQQGKTFQMLYGAMHGWNTSSLAALNAEISAGSGKQMEPPVPQSRMFVTLEMKPLPIEQRMAAMQTHLPMYDVKNASLIGSNIKKLKKGLTRIQAYGAPFWIVDGDMTASVEDIWMLARQLKPDAIFIDGAYILKLERERDRFRRVAENVDLIKTHLCPIAPTACSWQFAKSASQKLKKKHGDKVDLEDVGYSDAIAQYSSLVVGLLQSETIESITTKTIDILKGRAGETGQFQTNWEFGTMDFSEVAKVNVAELQYT